MWGVALTAGGLRCVFPIDDLRAHDLDGACWCEPFDGDGIVVHNSADGREDFETRRRLRS